MGKKKQNLIPKPKVPEQSSFVPNQPLKTLSETVQPNKLMPHLSFHHFDESSECISEWTQEETKQLFEKLRQFSQTTWQEIIETGGKGRNKTGFGFTEIQNTKNMKRKWPKRLSTDCTLSEIRICQKKRVFGVRRERAFYVIWLDRNHLVLQG